MLKISQKENLFNAKYHLKTLRATVSCFPKYLEHKLFCVHPRQRNKKTESGICNGSKVELMVVKWYML